MKKSIFVVACGAVILVAATSIFAAKKTPKLNAYTTVRPWTDGTPNDAITQSAVLATIPMFPYCITATKDSSTRTGVLVGRSPFARGKDTSTISVKLIPIIITIGSTTFDSTAVDTCTADHTHTTLDLMQNSPFFVNSALSLNGVSEGSTQYIDAFRRNEFETLVTGTSYHTMLSLTTLSAYTITGATVGTHGATISSGCSLLGTVNTTWFDTLIKGTILPSYGVLLGPTDFVVLLLRNVVQSTDDPPTFAPVLCCILGFHGATGSPVQTYGPMDYDSTGDFGAGTADASIIAHEIAEWVDDPLGTNATPRWGAIGQVGPCPTSVSGGQTNLENGDPLSGTLAPAVLMPNGVTYHAQELAFFSWFFNAVATPTLGAASKYSSNGTFTGPSKVCPPGGTN